MTHGWHEDVESANVTSFVWLLYQCLYKRSSFWLWFSKDLISPQARTNVSVVQPRNTPAILVPLVQWRTSKSWPLWQMPRFPDMFITKYQMWRNGIFHENFKHQFQQIGPLFDRKTAVSVFLLMELMMRLCLVAAFTSSWTMKWQV